MGIRDRTSSLADFFARQGPTTLDNCDREPIHLSGAIQAVGGLLAVDQSTRRVVVTSEEAGKIYGKESESLLGASLESLDGSLMSSILDVELHDDTTHFSILVAHAHGVSAQHGRGEFVLAGSDAQGSLWGLIACHSDSPGMPPYDCWMLARDVANSLCAFLKDEEQRQAARKTLELREIERELSRHLANQADFDGVMGAVGTALLGLLDADGFAFKYGPEIQIVGETPPVDFIRELVEWLPCHGDADYSYYSSAFYGEWPRAAAHKDTAWGVLAQPIPQDRMVYMIGFRKPSTARSSSSTSWTSGTPQRNRSSQASRPRRCTLMFLRAPPLPTHPAPA